VALLSVPYLRRSWTDIRPTQAMKLMAGENQFYQLYFQQPGKAEAELEATQAGVCECFSTRLRATPFRETLALGVWQG
jgi:hypothetical protein